MEINIHIFTSIALVVVLYPFFGWISVFAIVGGCLVDFDHYLTYVMRKKDWSLKEAVNYYRRRRFAVKMPMLHIFHTIECFAVLAVISFYYNIFLVVLLGFVLHMLLDFADCAYYRSWFIRINSIIAWILISARKSTT